MVYSLQSLFAKDNDHINTQQPKGLFVAYNNSFQLCQKLAFYDTNSPKFHFTAHFEDPKLELNSFHSLALGCTWQILPNYTHKHT